MYVLGINASHDQSVALIKDGEVRVAIAEERLDRIKYSVGRLYWKKDKLGPKVLPWRGIHYCLTKEKIGLDDLDLVMVDHCVAPVNLAALREQLPLKDPEKIQAIPKPSHHLAHASSAYYCSGFPESAVLVVDHIGSLVALEEKESESAFLGKDNRLTLLFRRLTTGRDLEKGAASPANFYRLVTLLLGFVSQNLDFGQSGKWLSRYNDAGKTMGLAPYGRHRPDWEPWVGLDEEGNLRCRDLVPWLKKHKLLKTISSLSESGEKLKFLTLAARDPKSAFTRLHKDLAFKAQEELEKAMLLMTERLYRESGSENLCLAGGVALNSVANRKIIEQGLFKNVFIQPAATDDGNCIGAALYGYFNILKGTRRHRLKTAYLGRSYDDTQIRKALENFSLHHMRKFPSPSHMISFLAEEISQGKVVAWFQGGAEFGPRALGNRSLLADPRRQEMRDYINFKIKGREWFRPLAPAVLWEHCSDFFSTDHESPFMLSVAPVRPEKISEIPAVTHVDGTARLQTVRREDNPLFYELIEAFHALTKVPVLLNTSFNIRGFPIVETPSDAIWSFLNSPLDYLAIGSYLVSKELYADDALDVYRPQRLLKIDRDDSPRGKYFVYKPQEQKIRLLTAWERKLLEHCNGKRNIEELAQALRVKQGKVRETLRGFLREQLVYLLAPHQKLTLK